jgi:hypothetical protein
MTYPRECIRCNIKFTPNSASHRLCYDCIKKSQSRGWKRNNKMTIKKTKQPCKYWKVCCDYRRSRDKCHDKEEQYCKIYIRLNEKGKKDENKTIISEG